MRTRNIYGGLVMTAAALLCLAGCKKDEEGEKIMLGTQFEKAVSAQKTYLGENNTVCWSANDSVWVNGEKYKNISNSGIEVKPADNYYAVYPATAGNLVDANGGTVEIPAVQVFHTESDKQVLNGPMAARLDGKSGTLYFRNLYSLLKVTVSADDKNFTVNSITVTATGETPKALAGTYGFSFGEQSTTEAAPTVNPYANKEKDSSTSVKLTGINTPVTANNDADFYLVAHPMTSQKLTVKVEGVLDNKMVVYTYHTASARSLNRNSIGGLAVNLQQLNPVPVFSVGDGKYVTFSPGNLQYRANPTAWRFAEHQWDYVGDAENGTVYAGSVKCNNKLIAANYTGWIDLFGWSTSVSNYGISTSKTDADYSGDFVDWGKKIGDGSTWRTLTDAEWKYLLGGEGRSNGHKDWWLYNMVKITAADGTNDVVGLIIYPDGVVAQPAGILSLDKDDNRNAVKISKADFEKLEAMGCVFLPAAGYRDGTSVSALRGAPATTGLRRTIATARCTSSTSTMES